MVNMAARGPGSIAVSGVFLSVLICILGQGYELRPVVDLCDKRDGFEPDGEHLNNVNDSILVYANWTNRGFSDANQCLMRFSTCNHCRLHVQAEPNFHYRDCSALPSSTVYNGWCLPGCSYILLYDRDYSSYLSRTYTRSDSNNTGGILDFKTECSYLYVVACSNRTVDRQVFFQLRITAEEKEQLIEGSADEGDQFSLTTPFFPNYYKLNSELYTYIFQGTTDDEIITISFDDWNLSQNSYIQFDRANIRGRIRGYNNRPWIISDTNLLKMTFSTGDYSVVGSFLGFRMTYTFHNTDRQEISSVNSNCGKWIQLEESGTERFNPASNDYYDCIWIIQKHPNFDKVSLKVIRYTTKESSALESLPNLMEIREGLTSLGQLIGSVDSNYYPDDLDVFGDQESDDGFYVRIKGHFSSFVFAYTSFKYMKYCSDLFRCANERCVPRSVICDEVDHCGDNSDEMTIDCGITSRPGEFVHGNSINISIIIPLVVSIFLFIVISLLIVFIWRCRRLSFQARQAERRQRRIIAANNSIRRQSACHAPGGVYIREEFGPTPDLPPSYEDVLSNTPIGYLNLGYTDTSHLVSPVQPPSYHDATNSPATDQIADLQASDSSSSEAYGHLHNSTLTGSASDGTQRIENEGIGDGAATSSSDSSNERHLAGGEVSRHLTRDRMPDGRTSREDLSATRRSIAKPEDSRVQAPVSSSEELGDKHKQLTSQKAQKSKDDSPAVITVELSAENETSFSPDEDNRERCAPVASCYRTENSPLISAPPVLSSSSSQRHSLSLSDQEVSTARYLIGENAPPSSGNETFSSKRDGYCKSNSGKNVPPRIQKTKHSSNYKLMKHLSKSLNDLGSHSDEGKLDHENEYLPSRHFSSSTQNILDTASVQNALNVSSYLTPQGRRLHQYQSQPLSASQDSRSEMPESPMRVEIHQRSERSKSIGSPRHQQNSGTRLPQLQHRTRSQSEEQEEERQNKQKADQPVASRRPEPRPRTSRSRTEEKVAPQTDRVKPVPRPRSLRRSKQKEYSGGQDTLHCEGRREDGGQQVKNLERYNSCPDTGSQGSVSGQQPPHSLDHCRENVNRNISQHRSHPQRKAFNQERAGQNLQKEKSTGYRDHKRQNPLSHQDRRSPANTKLPQSAESSHKDPVSLRYSNIHQETQDPSRDQDPRNIRKVNEQQIPSTGDNSRSLNKSQQPQSPRGGQNTQNHSKVPQNHFSDQESLSSHHSKVPQNHFSDQESHSSHHSKVPQNHFSDQEPHSSHHSKVPQNHFSDQEPHSHHRYSGPQGSPSSRINSNRPQHAVAHIPVSRPSHNNNHRGHPHQAEDSSSTSFSQNKTTEVPGFDYPLQQIKSSSMPNSFGPQSKIGLHSRGKMSLEDRSYGQNNAQITSSKNVQSGQHEGSRSFHPPHFSAGNYTSSSQNIPVHHISFTNTDQLPAGYHSFSAVKRPVLSWQMDGRQEQADFDV